MRQFLVVSLHLKGFPVANDFCIFFPYKKNRDFFLINTTYINHNFFHSLGRSRKYDLFTPRRVVYVVFRRKLNSISQTCQG